MRTIIIVAAVVNFVIVSVTIVAPAGAHPGSGIVVDSQGVVTFLDSGHGVMTIDGQRKLARSKAIADGHWLAIDPRGSFSHGQPKYFQRITPEGVAPALILAGGGAPLVVGLDGNLYYGSGPDDDSPGGLSVTRETPEGVRTKFSPALAKTLKEFDDGVTGLAIGPDGSLYVACWTAVIRVKMDGTVTTLVHPIDVPDCDADPADHKPSNRLPYLRGLAVDAEGVVYAAATSCHCVIKVTPEGHVSTVLKSERPWSPTGVAARGHEIYVLEYTNANGPATEGWHPRVRELKADGSVKVLAELEDGAGRD
jgi:hypothetical protein